ncbi:DUF2515 family protein [Pontibacillus yanchengensis]|uniref:DUF2515 domain-containing protein n=1 Tax=Pontibacillus yanchengensis Y32 TaxID=1385514 RepID=A0A0A2TDY0_9BACI|nr:DUF2515 family protein [Pontibacillus yanchengensis]KGP72633.1 hypothetical protein N782_11230 [Pontibacillus yanchengensis Y32]
MSAISFKQKKQHYQMIQEMKEEMKGKNVKENVIPTPPSSLSTEEQAIINRITHKTHQYNKDNVTRTEAYLNFYQEYPEIEWALLAHLVSRNSGWNMTDLKGECLPHLLSEQEQIDFFMFLERGNWLIFQDAYPQLLLYEESQKQQKPLFHLLPVMNISSFMETNWHYYWNHQSKTLLTYALITNEQHYIEHRLVDSQQAQKNVLGTIEFKLQELLSLNHILFPYQKGTEIMLMGETVHHFASIHKRIELGKRLYHLLFKDKRRLKQVLSWTSQHPHTGSRMDYWPHLFHHTRDTSAYPLRLKTYQCKLKPGAPLLYSPRLQNVWQEVSHQDASIGDWFDDWDRINFLAKPKTLTSGKIKSTYCETITKLELAALMKKTFLRVGEDKKSAN